MCGGETWGDSILPTRHMVRLDRTVLRGLGPPRQVEAAVCEDPPGPAPNSAIPGSIPPPALKASVPAGQDERRHSASPPPAPPSPEHRQPVQKGQERGRKSQHLSAVAGQECPRQGARPSLLGPAGQTEGSEGRGAVPSQLARETSRGASTGPSSGTWRRGAGRPGGHRGLLRAKVSPSWLFWRCSFPRSQHRGAQLSPVPLEPGTSGHHQPHCHVVTCVPAPTPELPLCRLPQSLCTRLLPGAGKDGIQKDSGKPELRLA